MEKFFKNFINDKRKTLSWKNANFFYISTFLFALTLIITFLCCRPAINSVLDQNMYWNILLLPFRHLDWIHLIGNLLCFLTVSLYLERRYGSLKYILIILISIILSPLANFALLGLNGQGESLVNFFLFGIFWITFSTIQDASAVWFGSLLAFMTCSLISSINWWSITILTREFLLSSV